MAPTTTPSGTEPAVLIEGLRRVFTTGRGSQAREVTALDGLDLSVARGSVHGLLGPNGAGKTTLCKILSTTLLPTGGRARILGHDVATETLAVRRAIGIVLGGDRGLYGRLTARQNIDLWGALYGLYGRGLRAKVEELLEEVGLSDRADDKVNGFSRGMKQRLHLARGLVGDPQVLLLDEPTTGMDPVAANSFRDFVGRLKAEGRTVLITTHDMAQAEAVCDEVTLIDRGRVLTSGDPRRLAELLGSGERVEATGVPAALVARIGELPGTAVRTGRPEGELCVETDSAEATREVLTCLVEAGVSTVRTGPPSLEELYVRVIGERKMKVSA
ncbi:ABC-2 type transporter ATP-binding protein [Kitasatospora sp. MMS16-BH015]|uniref:ABC transporter ATP-binding protein n=1 Tax=Kitasatospora sp. MMS16-BH015 TaxID=2018025 RepID=UPI000CA0F8CE|nr:ABC transporter ATP-binding protein [Kitasatospora sp. MMS16-BH015]AUG78257.1 ABC-2 type transporter ATP-binding protein [Kitasatospora sp. MMS16-BH015]